MRYWATFTSLHFIVLLGLDVTISGLVGFRLIRAKVDCPTRTRRLVNKLIVINFEAALPPTVCLLLAVAFLWIPVSARRSFSQTLT